MVNKLVIYGDELYHYGRPGQKWGIRNGPPYPLDASPRTLNKQKINKKSTGDYSSLKWKKRLKTGMAVTAGCLIIYGGIKIASSSKLNSYLYKATNKIDIDSLLDNIGPEIVKKMPDNEFTPDTFTPEQFDILGLDELDLENGSASNYAKGINPTNSTTNCGSVSSAVLANLMGNNCEALPEVPMHMRIKGGSGYDPDKLIDCYQGGEWSKTIKSNFGSRKAICDQLEFELLAQGNGAKGIFYCEKLTGRNYGHYFCYAIIDNKVHILEGQPKSAQQTGIDWFDGVFKNIGRAIDAQDGNYGVRYARLDNCPIKSEREKDLFIKK